MTEPVELELRGRLTALEQDFTMARKLVFLCFALELAIVAMLGLQAWRQGTWGA
jgi:hypothetical protein